MTKQIDSCCLYLPLLLQENSRITLFKLTESLNTSTSIWQTRFKRYLKAEVRTGSRTSTFHSSLQTLKCLTTLFSRGIPPPYSAFYKQLFPSNNFENPTVKALEQKKIPSSSLSSPKPPTAAGGRSLLTCPVWGCNSYFKLNKINFTRCTQN